MSEQLKNDSFWELLRVVSKTNTLESKTQTSRSATEEREDVGDKYEYYKAYYHLIRQKMQTIFEIDDGSIIDDCFLTIITPDEMQRLKADTLNEAKRLHDNLKITDEEYEKLQNNNLNIDKLQDTYLTGAKTKVRKPIPKTTNLKHLISDFKNKLAHQVSNMYGKIDAKYSFTSTEYFKYLNQDLFDDYNKKDKNIVLSEQKGHVKVKKELKDAIDKYLSGGASLSLHDTPIYACIGMVKGKTEKQKLKQDIYHMSAVIFYNHEVYSIGLSQIKDPTWKVHIAATVLNEEVLNNFESFAVINSPESEFKEYYSMKIIDMGILTHEHINKIENIIKISRPITSISTFGDKYNIEFDGFMLEANSYYCRFTGHSMRSFSMARSLIDKERNPTVRNCASFIEELFGIKCDYALGFFPRNPNWCRRANGNKFTITDIDRIIVAFKDDDLNKFERVISGTQSPNQIPAQHKYVKRTVLRRRVKQNKQVPKKLNKTERIKRKLHGSVNINQSVSNPTNIPNPMPNKMRNTMRLARQSQPATQSQQSQQSRKRARAAP